jgi:hypothetical protein
VSIKPGELHRAEQRLVTLQNTTAAAMSYIELERQAIRAKIARLKKQRFTKEAEAG